MKVGTVNEDRIDNMEGVTGGSGADTLTGDSANNYFYGNSGNDVLSGGDGTDSIYAGTDNNTLISGGGSDYLYGDAGIDTVDFSAETVVISVGLHDYDYYGSSWGSASVGSGMSSTYDTLAGIENVSTGTEADTLIGSALANILDGNGGSGTINGKGGNDILIGDGGADNFVFGGNRIGDFGAILTAAEIGLDEISGFALGDKILLDKRTFASFASSTPDVIDGSVFVKGSLITAMQRDDRLFYDTDDGRLYYDEDGSSTQHSAVAFAILNPKYNLAASELAII